MLFVSQIKYLLLQTSVWFIMYSKTWKILALSLLCSPLKMTSHTPIENFHRLQRALWEPYTQRINSKTLEQKRTDRECRSQASKFLLKACFFCVENPYDTNFLWILKSQLRLMFFACLFVFNTSFLVVICPMIKRYFWLIGGMGV